MPPFSKTRLPVSGKSLEAFCSLCLALSAEGATFVFWGVGELGASACLSAVGGVPA